MRESFKDCLEDWRESVPLERVMVVDARRIAVVIRFLREGRGEPDDVESALLGLGVDMAGESRRVDQEEGVETWRLSSSIGKTERTTSAYIFA